MTAVVVWVIVGVLLWSIAIAAFYFSTRNFKHLMAFKILGLIFGCFTTIIAIAGTINMMQAITHTGDYSPEAVSSSKASESRESAKEAKKEAESKASESESEAESTSISKAQSSIKKNAISELNQAFDSNPSLAGLHIEKDPYGSDDDYDVIIPDELAAAPDNEQKEDYRTIVKIIREKTGDTNPSVFFMDSGHNTVAETTWSGEVKLHK